MKTEQSTVDSLAQYIGRDNAERFFQSIREGLLVHAQRMADFHDMGCDCWKCRAAKRIMKTALMQAYVNRDAVEGRR